MSFSCYTVFIRTKHHAKSGQFFSASKQAPAEGDCLNVDEEHPWEDRYDVLGKIVKVLFIVCTFRKGNVVHIISARCATASEKARYEHGEVIMNSLPAELTPDEIAEIEAAEKMSAIFDDDCPKMTDPMLKQFRHPDTVTIRISPDSMEKIRSFGAD